MYKLALLKWHHPFIHWGYHTAASLHQRIEALVHRDQVVVMDVVSNMVSDVFADIVSANLASANLTLHAVGAKSESMDIAATGFEFPLNRIG